MYTLVILDKSKHKASAEDYKKTIAGTCSNGNTAQQKVVIFRWFYVIVNNPKNVLIGSGLTKCLVTGCTTAWNEKEQVSKRL